MKFLRRTESDRDSLRSLGDKIVGDLLMTVVHGFRIRRSPAGYWISVNVGAVLDEQLDAVKIVRR